MLQEQLKELGFTPNQSAVYTALLELGQAKAGEVVKKVGLHRHLVYRALRELASRKLVAEQVHRGVAFFQTTDPSPLIEELTQKLSLARLTAEAVARHQRTTRLETEVLTGSLGLEVLTHDILAQKDDLFVMGENGMLHKRYPRLFRTFHEARQKRGIHAHLLIQPRAKVPARLQRVDITALPYPIAPSVSVWMYSGVMALILWETPELIYLLRNKKIAEGFRDYFTLLTPASHEKSKVQFL